MTVTLPQARPITDALWQRLTNTVGAPTLNWYRSEVDDHPPTLPGDTRVAAYGVLYPFPGKPYDPSEQDLAHASLDIDYGVQLTIAAGYSTDCEYVVDAVHAWVYGWSPTVAGVVCGQFRPPLGYDPGPVQRSGPGVTPPRFSLPLQYRLTATTT